MPTLTNVRGLNTFDSELSLAAGTLKEAKNVVVDRRNTARPRRGFADYHSLPLSGDRIKQILEYKDTVMYHYDNTIRFDDGSGNFTSFDGTYSELEAGLRLKYRESNSNLYFTTSDGIKKISATASSEFTSNSGYIENAGIPKALDTKGKVIFDIAGFLPASSKVAYRVVWGKNDTNSNLLLSGVGSRLVVTNDSADVTVREKSTVDTTGSIPTDIPTDVHGTYFTLTDGNNNSYYVWYSDGSTVTKPVDSQTIGKTEIEVDLTGASTEADVAAYTGSQLAQIGTMDVVVNTNLITITNKTGDDVTNIENGLTPTGFTFATIEQGQVISGLRANVDLTFTIPNEINTTDYFYQVYRTGVFTTSTGVELVDIDPGDEMNLVLESGITDAEIAAGEILVTDDTSESFRESGAILYTNPQSGDGILQSNERPPIAHDIASFRNSMFYANTKTAHRLTLNLLSVVNFTSGTSKLIIGNSSATREYTFVGATQVQTFDTVADVAESLDGKYFTVSSASDEVDLYVWYTTKSDNASDPAPTGKLGIKVQIEVNDTADTVAALTASALQASPYFDADNTNSSTNTVTATWASNGNVVGDITDVDTTFTINTPSTEGDGEEADTAAGGDVLLSSLLSIGGAIDETARSLVNIINNDSNGVVYAYYISGPDSLPGIISLESREITDDPFYMSVNESAIQDKFSPEMDLRKDIATTVTTGDPVNINVTAHGYSTGDSVYVYGLDTNASVLGKYTITVTDVDNFTIPVNVQLVTDGDGFVFKADTASDNEVKPNRLYYSKTSRPEAVPLVNYLDIGAKDKPIERIIELRDNLYVFKDDGVYIVTGTSIPFQTRLIDSSATIIAPDSAAVLNNNIFFLSTQGVATASDAGISIISKPIENLILDATRVGYSHKSSAFGIGYENDRSYLLWMPSEIDDTVATNCYRYSTHNGYWTTWELTNTCGLIKASDDKLYLGAGDRNVLSQERKNGDRTDYTDRDIALAVPSDSINGVELDISNAVELEKGDVLVQDQYLTIAQFNRVLKKLDKDFGLDDTDYESVLTISSGANLSSAMTLLVSKLNADDSSATTYSFSGTSVFSEIQTEFNTLMDDLTDVTSDPNYNYDSNKSSGITQFENIILDVDKRINRLTLSIEMPFLEGDITAYKGYECTVEWAPQHFGDASMYKQVPEGSILFDANNFYSANIEFATDRSKNFSGSEFFGKGTGAFGGNKFGNTVFGGDGTDEGVRTIVPRDKQRCRYISCRFRHINAREDFNLLGISMKMRQYSTRAYRTGANNE